LGLNFAAVRADTHERMSPAKPQMDVCPCCGKLYPRVYVRLCQSCMAVEENRFELIRRFLEQAQGTAVGIPDICEWTGLSRGEVVRFQEQGRLVDVDPGLGGKPTTCSCPPGTSGRCAYCRMQMADNLRTQLEAPDARRPVGEVHGTLDPNARPAPRSRPGGGDAQPARDGMTTEIDEYGRVHYVRRVRRAG
jgi:hypothetical protein